MNLMRVFKHLLHFPWRVHRVFPAHTLRAIESAIHDSEQYHCGELRFAVEGALDIAELWHGVSARERALNVFADLRVWDTEHNNGVLIYLLLADRDVEIVADRGIHGHIAAGEWEAVCRAMEALLRHGKYEAAALQGVALVGELLQRHYPAQGRKRNELDNRPVVVKR
ncbi:hypothetical protein TPL01_25930 [Sulfuriferula plumbiphila]|uniref:TPM domain-containing protein n=1 Tax=Sulfuriferula plumbiphila TaxID=171865 RepID=A0A512LAE2_9PROT|nr:TPM domain-containing protein [Sulfuriferula plumbiphila]BBP04978.1 hypothetical protein SFPGR_24000 [Sulfuriferula plumbiphila]GEP31455.1 hypothetical protein TPL01_25930 [Sulfuriferula plumbiphila]